MKTFIQSLAFILSLLIPQISPALITGGEGNDEIDNRLIRRG